MPCRGVVRPPDGGDALPLCARAQAAAPGGDGLCRVAGARVLAAGPPLVDDPEAAAEPGGARQAVVVAMYMAAQDLQALQAQAESIDRQPLLRRARADRGRKRRRERWWR